MRTILLCAVMGLLGMVLPALGANKYLREGATGAATGADWTDAVTTPSALQTALSRGDTGYIADGNYAGIIWNKAESGTTLITIKKATVADHGTATGWSDAYGDGQATFNDATVWFGSGYWVWDGVNGAYSRTANAISTPYGFFIDAPTNSGTQGVQFQGNNITFRKTEVIGNTNLGDWAYVGEVHLIQFVSGANITVQDCYAHGGDTILYAGNGDRFNGWDTTGLIIESNVFQAARGGAPLHNNIFYCTGTSNGVWRYNYTFNFWDEGMFFTWWEASSMDWKIYGNIFSSVGGPSAPGGFPRGIELRVGGNFTNIHIYNNTFFSLSWGWADRSGTPGEGDGYQTYGCTVSNNISSYAPSVNYTIAAVGNETDDTVDRFVNVNIFNYALTGALAGASMAVEFNKDINGVTRGGDGVWDRGALEYFIPSSGPAPSMTLGSGVTLGAGMTIR